MSNEFDEKMDEGLGEIMVQIKEETEKDMDFILNNKLAETDLQAFQMTMYKRIALMQFRLEYLFQITTPLAENKDLSGGGLN